MSKLLLGLGTSGATHWLGLETVRDEFFSHYSFPQSQKVIFYSFVHRKPIQLTYLTLLTQLQVLVAFYLDPILVISIVESFKCSLELCESMLILKSPSFRSIEFTSSLVIYWIGPNSEQASNWGHQPRIFLNEEEKKIPLPSAVDNLMTELEAQRNGKRCQL